MNKHILILILGIMILAISGCTQKVVCNDPYIQVGSECCLDRDTNYICDKDEIKTTLTPEPSGAIAIKDSSEPTITASDTYCGDGECQSDESCSSCSPDCGSCALFTIGDSFGYSGAKNYEVLGTNNYKIVPSSTTAAIYFPITFNKDARDIEFNWECFDGTSRLDSQPDTHNAPGNYLSSFISDGEKNIGLMGRFGVRAAQTCIFKNSLKNFGAEIEYISAGEAVVNLDPSSNWGSTRNFNCELEVTSHNPPYQDRKSFTLMFT